MTDGDFEEIGKYMTERNWVAWMNPNQLWAMGVETKMGLNVLGMGRSLQEAFEMAKRSEEPNGRSEAEAFTGDA